MSVAEQAAAMAEARFVIGESGAAMANVGFCPQGATVLELQPERFVEGWTRGMCFHLGHRWHLYLARVELAAAARRERQDARPQPALLL